jgi:transcriptional regulator with XRE-family HTH domain
MVPFEPADLLRELGDRVRSHRNERKLSQEQLAERAGLHRNYVGGIEQGRRNVSIVNLYKLATALELDVGELIGKLHAPE